MKLENFGVVELPFLLQCDSAIYTLVMLGSFALKFFV